MNSAAGCIRLIVNADDYGYFTAVSRGIREAHARGIVTATGIMANGQDLDSHLGALADHSGLDLGIHLNLTHGRPLTLAMAACLAPWGGAFPGKFAVTTAILRGRIGLDAVAAEWRAQIERCLARRVSLVFLNSHEHVHMLPPLFTLTRRLANEYGIRHVRLATPEPLRRWSTGGVLRGSLMAGMALLDGLDQKGGVDFLGLGESGRLGPDYLRWMLPRLKAGRTYELMCHPGFLDPAEVADARLLAYHDWEGELALLTHPDTRAWMVDRGVRLVGYRDLDTPPPAQPMH